MGSQIEEPELQQSTAWREQRYRRGFWLLRQSGTGGESWSVWFPGKQNGRWLKCVCQRSCYLKSWNQGCEHGSWTECRQYQHEEKWAKRLGKIGSAWLQASVLSSFSFRLFCVIQVFTSESVSSRQRVFPRVRECFLSDWLWLRLPWHGRPILIRPLTLC